MFINIQVTTTNQGQTALAAYRFDTVQAAKSNHFYFLSSCYSNTSLDYFLGEIVDANGACVACESWKASAPEPEEAAE